MRTNELTSKAHAWVRELKAKRNLNYEEIAAIIGYSGAGISKALRNETLSMEQLKMIAINLNLLDEFESEFMGMGVTGPAANYVNDCKLGFYLDKNHETLLLNNASYRLWYEKSVAVEAMMMFKDLLTAK